MRISHPFLLACIVSLIFSPQLMGQVSVNVRLQSGNQALQTFLDQQQNQFIRQSQIPPALSRQFPFVSKIQQVESLHAKPSSQFGTSGIDRIYTLEFEDAAIGSVLAQLRQSGAFEFVEENRRISVDEIQEIAYTPNDDSLANQWYHPYIRSFEAWDLTTGSSTIKVGVVDTGLDYDHPEFSDQLAINILEDANGNGSFEPWSSQEMRNGISGDFDGTDADNNGFIDDVIGYDFVHQTRNIPGGDYLFSDPDPLDDNRHGTAVAGVIFANADNNYGGAGLAFDCKLVVLRAFAADGTAEDDDIARAIVYATDNGVKILNFSFGDIVPSTITEAAIQYAYQNGVTMVASAGNGTGDEPHYPSSHSGVISVSGTTVDLNTEMEFLWPISAYGVTTDLAAPASRIYTPSLRDTASNGTVTEFIRTQGTSFAAPMVSAGAALIMAHKGYRTPDQIRGILTSSADDMSDPGWDHLTGAGRLNLLRALQVVGASNVQLTSPVNDGGSSADSVYIIGTVLDPEMIKYHIEIQEGIEDLNEWIPIVSDQVYQRKDDTLAIWDTRPFPPGEYTLRLRVEKTNGFTAEDRIRFIKDITAPETVIQWAHPAWDNDQRAMFFRFRSDDEAEHTLYYRPAGTSSFKSVTYDRITQHGELLLSHSQLSAGSYDYYLQSTNRAGLSSQTDILSFDFQPAFIPRNGLDRKSYAMPMGFYLPDTYDFDKDGMPEVVMNQYDSRLSFSQMNIFEFNGGFFSKVDSTTFRPILIPKGVADVDNDGLLELLSSVNDSNFVIEQPNPTAFPAQPIVYSREGDGVIAAGYADTDGDNQMEMILKNPKDYFIFESQGQGFAEVATLPDISPDFSGGNAPRVLVDDFDGDQRPEIIFQDADGDVLIYEHEQGNTYRNRLVDSSKVIALEGGSYLTKGDFDGDGIMEFFVAINSNPSKRNADFEYDAPYWWLRIFKSTADNEYSVVWEDLIYDVDNSRLNAATAGNLDEDPAEELMFSTYPRTYLIEYDGTTYDMSWYLFGSFGTHHFIADFDKNGVNEIGIGLIDSGACVFFEKQLLSPPLSTVNSLTGKVTSPTGVQLSWLPSNGATEYELWRVRDPFTNDTAQVFFSINNTTVIDNNVSEDTWYLYVIRAVNPGVDTSGFGNFVILRPHALPRLDSVKVRSPKQLEAFFSQPIAPTQSDMEHFVLDEDQFPITLIGKGNPGTSVLLNFARNLSEGTHVLEVDSLFQDAGQACMDPAFSQMNFDYQTDDNESLILTQWEILGVKEALLQFNFPLEESSALDSNNYSLSPIGSIVSVEWGSDDMDAIKVQILDAKFGALGYPLSITVTDVCAINEVCTTDEGNVATFSSHKKDLSEVFVYPNPSRPHKLFEGVRFANLTQQATIEVFTVSGRFINKMEEIDGDGGLQWDLRDEGNNRIRPGLYIYRVSTEEDGIEDFVGKFSVVE
ncbi:MAG: S8 family serine peptidase [Bacteroidota bacterium]